MRCIWSSFWDSLHKMTFGKHLFFMGTPYCPLKEELNAFKRNVLLPIKRKHSKLSATKPFEKFLDVIKYKIQLESKEKLLYLPLIFLLFPPKQDTA